jgi:hypothetical protein
MSSDPTDTDTQRHIATLISAIDVPAPDSLHASVGQLVRDVQRHGRRVPLSARRPTLLLAGAGTLAAAIAALVLVLVLGSSGTAAPTVLQVSALAGRPATLAAPEEDPHNPGHLAISADGIAYPYWEQRFGWRASGMRTDTIGGRAITTVFYSQPARSNQHIGYTIVAGRALPIPASGHTLTWRGVSFKVLNRHGSTMMTWRRAGHTCILVGAGVSARALLALAGWQTS